MDMGLIQIDIKHIINEIYSGSRNKKSLDTTPQIRKLSLKSFGCFLNNNVFHNGFFNLINLFIYGKAEYSFTGW